MPTPPPRWPKWWLPSSEVKHLFWLQPLLGKRWQLSFLQSRRRAAWKNGSAASGTASSRARPMAAPRTHRCGSRRCSAPSASCSAPAAAARACALPRQAPAAWAARARCCSASRAAAPTPCWASGRPMCWPCRPRSAYLTKPSTTATCTCGWPRWPRTSTRPRAGSPATLRPPRPRWRPFPGCARATRGCAPSSWRNAPTRHACAAALPRPSTPCSRPCTATPHPAWTCAMATWRHCGCGSPSPAPTPPAPRPRKKNRARAPRKVPSSPPP